MKSMFAVIAAGALAVGLTLLSGPAGAQAPTAADYAKRAAMGDLFEIESSELALKSASADAVKSFARTMIDDHRASSAKLKAATQKDSVVVSFPNELDGEHQEKLDDLEGESGDAFDRAYIKIQVEAHEDALGLHKSYAGSGDKPALKKAAGEIAAVVARHLQHINTLDTKH